ncbi:unnamed protein product [Gadus morhua 'NCC']
MVDINCTYEYPDNVQYRPNTVRTLWFTKGDKYQPVDLEHDTDYTGRVESSCGEVSCTGSRCHGTCTLIIRDLRQSDSAVYKFRFTTNLPGGEYTGDPGVMLTLTDLQVKVSFLYPENPTWAELECRSMCGLAGDTPYIWIRNGQNAALLVRHNSVVQASLLANTPVQSLVTTPMTWNPMFSLQTYSETPNGEQSHPVPHQTVQRMRCTVSEVKVTLLLRKRGLEKLVSSTLLCSQQTLAVRPIQDQGVNHPELRQMNLLVRCTVSAVKVALLLRKRGLEKLVSSTRRCHPLCSQQTLPVRPIQDQGVNHPELRQMALLVRFPCFIKAVYEETMVW